MTRIALSNCRQSCLWPLDAKQPSIKEYCHRERLQLAGVFANEAGAADVPLTERPAGKFLFQNLRPGCHVIIHELSLAFPSIVHFQATMKTWLAGEITLHLLRGANKALNDRACRRLPGSELALSRSTMPTLSWRFDAPPRAIVCRWERLDTVRFRAAVTSFAFSPASPEPSQSGSPATWLARTK
jgi:hypothetical protein